MKTENQIGDYEKMIEKENFKNLDIYQKVDEKEIEFFESSDDVKLNNKEIGKSEISENLVSGDEYQNNLKGDNIIVAEHKEQDIEGYKNELNSYFNAI